MFRFLMVVTINSTVGLKAWINLFNNFAVEVAHLDSANRHESVREIPSFLALFGVWIR